MILFRSKFSISCMHIAAIVLAFLLMPLPLQAKEKPSKSTEIQLEQPKQNTEAKPLHQLSLDELFGRLKNETNARIAVAIEKAIWQRWVESGSETVDLLMGWASNAIKKKDWNTALDLLDQVVVLVPHYAEGWNRRAMVHFLREDFSRSMHDIEQVLKLEHRHFGAMAGMGGILQQLDNHQKALVMWQKVLELYPANTNAQKAVEQLEEKLSGQGI